MILSERECLCLRVYVRPLLLCVLLCMQQIQVLIARAGFVAVIRHAYACGGRWFRVPLCSFL